MAEHRAMNHARAMLASAGLALLIALAIAGCNREAVGDYPAANETNGLPAISLTDQHGNSVSLASLKGKPVLVDFIYTSCASTCPRLTAKMVEVARELGPELGEKATIISITLDPEHDSPAELAKYAKVQGADERGWLFLTGPPAQIDQVLALYKLRRDRESDGSVTHSVSAFLLGPDGRQMRQYNALDVSAKSVAADVNAVLSKG
ncbi:MAG: SCO family protein [Candidatus Binatus sp.]|uniref:SCO family protein n=1 Tax=Candidatus Binatus sp. TaxID=2811406 RepID=UPI002715FEFB|nr:SCO family protein [Candidatus Binatus sp.]MDO8432011.1 SCO family protein [Candidatus Binatus sp.]